MDIFTEYETKGHADGSQEAQTVVTVDVWWTQSLDSVSDFYDT